MGLILLLSCLLATVSALSDPCNNCPLPVGFDTGDASLCQDQPIDDSYSPVLIKHSYGGRCYLQMTGCPAFDIISGSECAGILSPQQALECIDGKFRTPGRVMGLPIDKIRCNPDAYITPLPNNVVWSDCSLPAILSETDETTSCGSGGSAGIDMTRTSNGTHVLLTFSRCQYYELIIGYDETGTCRAELNIVGICENGRFKLDGREIHKARCGGEGTPSTPPISCNDEGWHYYWITNSSYKIGFNKTYFEAKVACAAEGGELASIHSQQERNVIMLLIWSSGEKANGRRGISSWIGVISDGTGGFKNLDGSPFDHSYWAPESPGLNGSCVRILSKVNPTSDKAGEWENVPRSTQTDSYVCKRPTPIEKAPCYFKEMLEEWRFQSCFNGGSFKLGETLEIHGKAPTVAPGDVWSINLETSSNAHALHILITEWGTDQPVIRIMSALNGFVETARYDCPYRPGVNYTFQVQNSEDQLRLIFNELDIQHPHFVSNPAEDYWAVAITIPYVIPQLYSAVITNGGIVDELGTGHTETPDEDEPVGCTSCPPLTQRPSSMEGVPNATFSATYDSSTGCMKASITCTATAPGRNVGMFSYENMFFGDGCDAVNYTNAYTCGSNGVWLDLSESEVMPLVECIQSPGVADVCQ